MAEIDSPPWEYEPIPPFILVSHPIGEPTGGWKMVVDFDDAMVNFAEFVPPKLHWVGYLVDADHKIVIAWTYPDPDYYPQWTGCRSAFDRLATLHEPVEVAFWEMQAQCVFKDLT